MSDKKQAPMRAIEKYLNKNHPVHPRKKKSNNKPEKEVEKQHSQWLKENLFTHFVAESKSTYSPKAGRYISQSLTPGVSDIIAVDSFGNACFLELKAPGKRSTVRPAQASFLMDKIEHNAFAIVTDSTDYTHKHYFEWLRLKKMGAPKYAQEYIKSILPQKGISSLESDDSGGLFD